MGNGGGVCSKKLAVGTGVGRGSGKKEGGLAVGMGTVQHGTGDRGVGIAVLWCAGWRYSW